MQNLGAGLPCLPFSSSGSGSMGLEPKLTERTMSPWPISHQPVIEAGADAADVDEEALRPFLLDHLARASRPAPSDRDRGGFRRSARGVPDAGASEQRSPPVHDGS